MKTSGHLASNGGIRGHSAGPAFPFIVVGTGDDMWYVQAPDGSKSVRVDSAQTACHIARLARRGIQSGWWGDV